MPTIENIQSLLTFGVAFQNLYKIEFGLGSNENLSLLCTNVKIPFFKIKEQRVFINHLERKFATGLDLDAVDFTFFIDKQYNHDRSIVIDYITKWHSDIYFKDQGQTKGFISYKNEYVKDIKISMVDENLRPFFTCTLKDAYPTNIQQIELTYDSAAPTKVTMALNFDDVEYEFTKLQQTKSATLAENPKNWKDKISQVKGAIQDAEALINKGKNLGQFASRSAKQLPDQIKNKGRLITDSVKTNMKKLS